MSHFNEKANDWDDESKVKMMGLLAKKTLEVLDIKKPVDILDFGCGTGLFGLEMVDIANTLVGIDTSEGMLEVFNKKTEGHENIESLLIDLETENYTNKFDLIVSSMTFHHLNNPKEMLTKLKSMLKPKGRIGIVDLDKEDGSFHPDNHKMGVKHFGFSKDELTEWGTLSKLKLDYQIINSIVKGEKQFPQFLAIFSN